MAVKGREAKFFKGKEFGTTQEGSSKVRYHRGYVISSLLTYQTTLHATTGGLCMCVFPTEASQSKIRSVED